jgi:uncharacterized protein YecE (DUF72 family)
MQTFVGVSGFSYSSWKGKFYPSNAKSEEFLALYSGHLDSVEINSTFYAPPRAAVVKGWSARTNEQFRFSFKAPKLITHIMKLGKESSDAADRFFGTLSLLGPRLGPVLFQLPPYAKLDHELLDEFLSKTSDIKRRVFEFRNETWFKDSTYSLLEDHGAGFCIADTEDLEPTFKVTGGIAYFRLRKDSYDESAMDKWSDKIRRASAGSDECYVYLRHDETGENALLAQGLSEKLHRV